MSLHFQALLIFLMAFCGSSYAEPKLSGPEIWDAVFVPALIDKFHRESITFRKTTAYLTSDGGKIVYDHGTTQTADPFVYRFLIRLGAAFGLKDSDQNTLKYNDLEAVILHIPGQNKFKWICARIKYHNFSPKVAHDIEQDFKKNRSLLSREGIRLLESLEQEKGLTEKDAQAFVHVVLDHYFKRQGEPMPRATLRSIEEQSPQAARALLTGPAITHVAIDCDNRAVEDLHTQLETLGIKILTISQSQKTSKRPQLSFLVEDVDFPILSEDSIYTTITRPARFIELIDRQTTPSTFPGEILKHDHVGNSAVQKGH